MIVELTKKDYEIFAEYLTLYQPNIEFNLITCDETLVQLGFVDEPICSVKISKEDLTDIMNASLDYEIEVYNTTDDEIDESSESYRMYCRYGWFHDYFYNKYG